MKDDSVGIWPRPSPGLMRGILAIGLLALAACADTSSDSRDVKPAGATEVADPPLVAAARKGNEAAVAILAALAKHQGRQDGAMYWRRLDVERGHAGSAHSLALAYEEKGGSTFPGPSAFRLVELILSERVRGNGRGVAGGTAIR